MTFCKFHWDDLKEKIRERGLSHFDAKLGPEMLDKLEGGEFQPLLTAQLRIMENLVNVNPQVLFITSCPICFVNEWHNTSCTDPECEGPDPYNQYTTFAADEQLETAKQLGLVISA